MRPHRRLDHTARITVTTRSFTDGTGQRVQHRLDRRRAGGRVGGRSRLPDVRPKILSPHYSDYRVLEGGQGAGTVASWKLQATKSRVRDVKANVDVAGHTVIEKDANSTMITNWTVAPAGPGSSVTVKTSWQGAGGIGGFFEKTFAPLGLRKIQAEVLENLKKEVEGRRPTSSPRAAERPASQAEAASCPGSPRSHAPPRRRTSAGLRASSSIPNRRGFSCCPIPPGSTGTEPG